MRRTPPKNYRSGWRLAVRTATVVAVVASLGACAGHRPAPVRPMHSSAAAAVQGPLTVTFTAPLIGNVVAQMEAKPTRDGFVASTREGMAWKLVGGIDGLLGRMFVPKLFPDGVILTWTSEWPAAGKAAEGRISAGKFKSAAVKTRMTSLDGEIEILTGDGRKIAVMRVQRGEPTTTPSDYAALAERIEGAVKERLYDREQAGSSPVRRYVSQVKHSAGVARDDVEFIFGAAVAGRNVKFSLPLVMKGTDLRSAFAKAKAESPNLATMAVRYSPETQIATIRVDAFLAAEDVDAAFVQAMSHDPAAIYLDLKDCPGVTLASLRVLSWISEEPVEAGVFFGQAERERVLRGRGAGAAEHRIDSAASVEALERVLDSGGAARVVVVPVAMPFHGPVAVRISKRTTTSAEPLVRVLGTTGLARTFGQATAGRPYLSRPIDVGQGWVLWLATCDYRGPDGERIDRGVRPQVETLSRVAADTAARDWLSQRVREGGTGTGAQQAAR